MNYQDTLQLPKTSFPMKADLAKREVEFLQAWESNDLYQKILQKNEGRPNFTLHDGPPYANGHISYNQVLNKVLKDFVVRSQNMSGSRCDFIPGWDCHGLPIESQVLQTLDQNSKTPIDTLELRKQCRSFAQKHIELQREEFKRLGGLGQWDNPYTTMDPNYEAGITRALAALMRSHGLEQRNKPVYWCPHCETALAEFEIIHGFQISPSLYVSFPLITDPIHIDPSLRGRDVEVLIWTTTPWTLQANLAIALHPEIRYAAVRYNRKVYLIAEERIHQAAKACDWSEGSYEVLLIVP